MNKKLEEGLALIKEYIKKNPRIYSLYNYEESYVSDVYLWFWYFYILQSHKTEKNNHILNDFHAIFKEHNEPDFIHYNNPNKGKVIKDYNIELFYDFICLYNQIPTIDLIKSKKEELSKEDYLTLKRAILWMKDWLDLSPAIVSNKINRFSEKQIKMVLQIAEFRLRTQKYPYIVYLEQCLDNLQKEIKHESVDNLPPYDLNQAMKYNYVNELEDYVLKYDCLPSTVATFSDGYNMAVFYAESRKSLSLLFRLEDDLQRRMCKIFINYDTDSKHIRYSQFSYEAILDHTKGILKREMLEYKRIKGMIEIIKNIYLNETLDVLVPIPDSKPLDDIKFIKKYQK